MQWLSTQENLPNQPRVSPPSFHLIVAASSRVDDLRAHFKNTYETARSVKGMKLSKAIKYMENVLEHKQCIPILRFTGHGSRTAQAKQFKAN